MNDERTPAAEEVTNPSLDPGEIQRLRRVREDAADCRSATPFSPIGSSMWILRPGAASVASACVLSWVTRPTTPTSDRESILSLAKDLLLSVHTVLSMWPYLAILVVFLAAVQASDTVLHNKKIRRIKSAAVDESWFVHPDELTDEARVLLARAQSARKTVLGAVVHRRDLLDRQRNETVLPEQEWELAQGLHTYSRLTKAVPAQPAGDEFVALLGKRGSALQASLNGLARRVSALETYADQVAAADRKYAELRQIQRLTADSDEVLDLLARSVRDDLAIAEVDGMTEQAALVATAFSSALACAKEAAVIALPTARPAA